MLAQVALDTRREPRSATASVLRQFGTVVANPAVADHSGVCSLPRFGFCLFVRAQVAIFRVSLVVPVSHCQKGDSPAPAAPPVDSDACLKAIRPFPSTASAGRSGLRQNHVKEALGQHRPTVSRACSPRWSCPCCKGRIAAAVRPLLCDARSLLCASPQARSSQSRSGKSFRLVEAKILVESVGIKVQAVLEFVQVGSAHPTASRPSFTRRVNSSPATASTQAWAVSLHVSNACNSVVRSAVLRTVPTACQGAAPWVDFFYGYPSFLFVAAETILSSQGFQQGGPLGRVLFALAIHPAVWRSRSTRLACCCLALPPVCCARVRTHWAFGLLDKSLVIPSCAASDKSHPGGLRRMLAISAALLKAIGTYDDTEGAFCLVRSCAGWSKILFCCRSLLLSSSLLSLHPVPPSLFPW